MPCLSGKFDPNIGPIVNIGVMPPGILTPTYSGNISTFPALIDTGASITCISQTAIQTVSLKPIGMRFMVSATHSTPVNVYLADLYLPFGPAGYIISAIQVMQFIPGVNAPFQMLLGRDLLCKGILTLSFDGHFTFSL